MTTTAVPERLYLIQLGRGTLETPGGAIPTSMGCYLIRMSDGSWTLIDSGLPVEAEPYGEPTTPLLDQLAGLGVAPTDIARVICTHFDIDHVGQNDAFPNAEFIVQREQYEAARSGHRRAQTARSHWDHPALHYREVDGDTTLAPGLELIATPGHAPGHQSVLLRLPNTGAVLLAIDAAPVASLFHVGRPPTQHDDDTPRMQASTEKLIKLVEREQLALTVFGHDGAQWAELRLAPAYYD